jgi:hypothetical protein
MKRILLFLSMLLCLTAGYAQDNLDGQCGGGPKGYDKPQPHPFLQKIQAAFGSIPILVSKDPNEIIGPEGYDSVRWVSINDVLNYTILFENDPEFATAAAQKVDIRFGFPNKNWMKGYGISDYCFSNLSFKVDKPSNAYQNRIDLKDTLDIYVDLIAGLDVAKQQGFWTFTTIDPETGYAPWEPEKGMLPVNDSTHVGEGYVTFQLKPYEGLHTGDSISIQASIVFDQNDTIPTNRWVNRIDAGNPESKVTAEAHPTLPSVYNLTFTGKDDEKGSGLKHLLLYLANHNGIYEEIDTVAVDSVLAFPVEAGKQYKLYSIAVDNTGNREPAKLEPDVILNFNQAPTDLILSDSTFQDDFVPGGFIGKLTSVDSEDEKSFTYALAEGDGAIHNDMFQITDDQLQIKNSFKCAEDKEYKVRISTTDDGGMSFSKAFVLKLENVLEKPKADSLKVNICEGETCLFHGVEYDKTGIYTYTQSNEYMCDSVYVLDLSVLAPLEPPVVTVEGPNTLVSSAAKGNQWFKADGTLIDGATGQAFTPEEDGIYYVAVSNGTCFSEPSLMYNVVLTDRIDLALDLQEGWNWMSSNLSENDKKDAKTFLEPLGEDVNRLVSISSELINDPLYGLVGSLSTIEPQQGYKLEMSKAAANTWSGPASRPEETAVHLHKGWNWIGYVPVAIQNIKDALSTLEASENAVIKGEDDFATFTAGQWTGSLEELQPGHGYMYYADKDITFNYPAKRAFVVQNSLMSRRHAFAMTRAMAPWQYNEYKYPDNTTMIARLNVNGAQAMEGAFTVGAFCDDECRGIGKWVDGLLFMTIHGTLSDEQAITFKAVENISGDELPVNETVIFDGKMIGTVNSPFVLNANGNSTKVETIDANYTVYPKPLRNWLYISGPTENIKSVFVLSTGGSKAISMEGYHDSGIDVSQLTPGVYVVAIVTNDGQTRYEKVMKVNN